MAQRHLYELLSEEQEPFVLKSFIDERRRQLCRTPSRPLSSPPPSSTSFRQLLHLYLKKHTARPPLPCVSSTLCNSSCIHSFNSPDMIKRSPLSQLSYAKSPSSTSRNPAAFLLETALASVQPPNQKKKKKKKKKKQRRERRNIDAVNGNPSTGFRLGFLASIMRRLVIFRKWRLEMTGKEEDGSTTREESGHMGWERRQLGDMGQLKHEGEGRVCAPSKPHCGVAAGCVRHGRDGAGEDDSYYHHHYSEPRGGSVSREKSSRQQLGRPSPGRPTPEPQTPASSSPGSPSTERQLLGAMGNNDGRTKPPCRDGDKQQLSPVSVLDPHFDEEEEGEVVDRRGHDHHHPQLGLGEEQVVAEEGNEEDEVESAFQQSLAAVQRTKQVLLSRIRRLERLADLDPVELDRRLAEEARDGASCDGPESVERFEVEQVPVDGKEAALDVSRVNPPAALRRRSKEGVEGSNATIDMMVEMDVRREGDTWRRWPEEVRVVAAEAEAAVFALLVHEVAEELEGCTRTRTRTRTTA